MVPCGGRFLIFGGSLMHSIKQQKRRAAITALVFILPFFILFTLFTVYPIIQGVWVSLNKWSMMGRQSYIGLENFEKLFSDSKFWDSLKHTCFFVVICAPLIVVASLALAILANRPLNTENSSGSAIICLVCCLFL